VSNSLSALGETLRLYLNAPVLRVLMLGFASGLPSPLLFSNLSIWLRDGGVSRTDVGLFALVATPYALNFLWAPLLDRAPLPGLRRLGQRRSWLVLCQGLMALALLLMSQSGFDAGATPESLGLLALLALLLATASATQDVVIDAFRIESLGPDRQGAGAAAAIWGWHLGGTLVGGAGGLMIAEALSWSAAYGVFALVMGGALGLTLLSPEPPAPPRPEAKGLGDQLRTAFFLPLKAFTRREGWALILIFIFVFKLGDALLGRMASVFYRELGFSLGEIAAVAKVYGLSANFVGIALGGVLVARLGLYRALFAGGLAAAATNLGYAALAHLGQASLPFTIAVVLDNFTGGLATVAFVAYLSSLCDRAYTATQYALLASLGNLARIWFSASAGAMVDGLGGAWDQFFLLTTVLACAGLPLLVRLMRRYPLEPVKEHRPHGGTN